MYVPFATNSLFPLIHLPPVAANSYWGNTFTNGGAQPMTQSLAIITGCAAGATESFVVTPFELVKIRLQDKASTYTSPSDVIKKTIAKDGPLGLYNGMEATFWRHVSWSKLSWRAMRRDSLICMRRRWLLWYNLHHQGLASQGRGQCYGLPLRQCLTLCTVQVRRAVQQLCVWCHRWCCRNNDQHSLYVPSSRRLLCTR